MEATTSKPGAEVTFVTDSPILAKTSISSAKRDRTRDQDSFDNFVSSMAMSLNSLDSKISPHSRHSTNSVSSSRATICTRGCLHCGMLVLFSGNWDGGVGVIKSGHWVSHQAGIRRNLPVF